MGRSMVRNMTIAADLGYLKVPEGVLIDTRRPATFPTTRSSTCRPGRRASRWPCSRAWPTSTTRSRSARATRSSSRRVSSPATRTPSTASSTASRSSARTSCTRATRRCTSRVTPLPASSSTATTSSAARTCCRSTASTVTSSRTPTSPRHRHPRAEHLHRRGRHRLDLRDGVLHGRRSARPRLRLRRRLDRRRDHRCRPQGPPHPRRGGLHLGLRRRRRDDRRVIIGPEIHARGFAEDDAVFERREAADHRGARRGRTERRPRLARACSRSSAARSAAG